jgi:hypothetical protein
MPNWKRVIVSGSNAALNSLNVSTSLTASGLIYPTADNGEESFIQTDGNGTLSLQYVKTIYEEIYNGEATQLVKGTPVYISGSVGAAARVFRADAGNPAKMPVIYISADTLAAGQTGRGIALGLIKGVNTTGYPAGTEIYVGVGGGWTSTRPTGSAIVQTLGYVTKEGAGGQGVVLNPGPNSLPNLPSGSVWVGNSSSIPTAVLTSSLSVASASFASTASFVSGGVTGTGTNGQVSFFTGTTTQAGDNGLFWDNTNKRLGIGLTNPSVSLQVAGDIHVSGGNRTIFNRSNNSLAFGTNNTERFRLTNGGDFIFGAPAVTPLARIHLRTNSALSTTNAFRLENSSPLPLLEISNSGRFILDGGLVRIEDFGDVKIQQNVGIGFSDTTTTPICRLDVRSNVPGSVVHRVSGTDGTLFQVVDDLSDNVLEANDISGINLFAVHSSGYTKHLSNREWGLTSSLDVFAFPTSSCELFKMMYSVVSGSNLRGGEYICVQNGTDVNTIHTFPTEFGDTSGIDFSFGIVSSSVVITTDITSGSWDVKLNVSML